RRDAATGAGRGVGLDPTGCVLGRGGARRSGRRGEDSARAFSARPQVPRPFPPGACRRVRSSFKDRATRLSLSVSLFKRFSSERGRRVEALLPAGDLAPDIGRRGRPDRLSCLEGGFEVEGFEKIGFKGGGELSVFLQREVGEVALF